jgi:hypothetical protein
MPNLCDHLTVQPVIFYWKLVVLFSPASPVPLQYLTMAANELSTFVSTIEEYDPFVNTPNTLNLLLLFSWSALSV